MANQGEQNRRESKLALDRLPSTSLNLEKTSDVLGDYDQQVEILMQKKTCSEFMDKSFPPETQKSISNDKIYLSSLDSKIKQKIIWKRPVEFMKENIKLFDEIEPMDIKQQNLGDCYLLGSLAALAEHPKHIERIFLTKQFQLNGNLSYNQGLYGLSLIHDGIKKQVVLDDYIPCKEKGGPIFSSNNGDELWVLLIEKAYAKLYGGYQRIISGLPGSALKDLTGAPYEYFVKQPDEEHLDAEKCWNFLTKNDSQKFILTAGSLPNQKGDAHTNSKGIASGHCYSILDLQEVVGSDGVQDRIIKMRNPWGKGEWTGDWSDDSQKWTPELLKRLEVVKKDDGIFWIGIQDFCKNYSQLCVSKIHEEYQYTSIQLELDKTKLKSYKTILMDVSKYSHGYIQMGEKDKRQFGGNHKYSLTRFIVVQISEDMQIIQVIGHNSSQYVGDYRDISIEGSFDPGYYLIFIEVDWRQQYDHFLSVSFYGESQVQFYEQQFQKKDYQKLMDQIVIQHSQQVEQDVLVRDDDELTIMECPRFGGYSYSIIINKSLEEFEYIPPNQQDQTYSVQGSASLIVRYKTNLKKIKKFKEQLIPFDQDLLNSQDDFIEERDRVDTQQSHELSSPRGNLKSSGILRSLSPRVSINLNLGQSPKISNSSPMHSENKTNNQFDSQKSSQEQPKSNQQDQYPSQKSAPQKNDYITEEKNNYQSEQQKPMQDTSQKQSSEDQNISQRSVPEKKAQQIDVRNYQSEQQKVEKLIIPQNTSKSVQSNQQKSFSVPDPDEDHPGRPKQNVQSEKSEQDYIKLVKKKIPKGMNFMIDQVDINVEVRTIQQPQDILLFLVSNKTKYRFLADRFKITTPNIRGVNFDSNEEITLDLAPNQDKLFIIKTSKLKEIQIDCHKPKLQLIKRQDKPFDLNENQVIKLIQKNVSRGTPYNSQLKDIVVKVLMLEQNIYGMLIINQSKQVFQQESFSFNDQQLIGKNFDIKNPITLEIKPNEQKLFLLQNLDIYQRINLNIQGQIPRLV
ncbi:hypothetical protein pb186bvf_000653 [Paramecium bursaria]